MSDVAIGQASWSSRIRSHRIAGEAPLTPYLLLTALLFAASILAGWQMNGRYERALLYAAYGSAGMPVALAWSPDVCRTAADSMARIRHADLLALLESR